MPDNKLYLIQLDGVEGQAVKDAAWYEQKKDDLFKKYPNAQIFEMSDYDENDSRDTDQYAINIKGADGTAIKDAAWYKEKKGALEEKYGNDASVKRLRAVDYWYDKAIADDKAIGVLKEDIAKLRTETYSEDEGPQYALSNPYDPELSPEEYAAFEKELASMTDEQVAEIGRESGYFTLEDRKRMLKEKEDSLKQLQADYDANPRVIEYKKFAEAAQQEEQNKLYDDLRYSIFKGRNSIVETQRRGDLGASKNQDAASNFLDAYDYLKNNKRSVAQGMWYDIWESVGEDDYDAVHFVLSKLENKFGNLNDISAEQIDSALTESEKVLLQAYFLVSEEEAKTSGAFQGGQIAGESVLIAGEMLLWSAVTALSGGTAAPAAGAAMTVSLGKGAMQITGNVLKGLGKWALKNSLKAAAFTALAPTTYTHIAKNKLQIGENGRLMDETEDVLKYAAQEFIENFTEFSGEGLVTGLKYVGKGLSHVKPLAKLGDAVAKVGDIPLGKLGDLRTVGKYLSNSKGMQIAGNMGFQGLPAEILEELEGAVLNEATGLDNEAFEHFFDKDNFGTMLIGFAPMTLFGAGASSVSMYRVSRKMSKSETKLRESLFGLFTEEELNGAISKARAAETSVEISDAMQDLMNIASKKGKTISNEQLKAMTDFGKAVAGYKVTFSGEYKDFLKEVKLMQQPYLVGQNMSAANLYDVSESEKKAKQAVIDTGMFNLYTEESETPIFSEDILNMSSLELVALLKRQGADMSEESQIAIQNLANVKAISEGLQDKLREEAEGAIKKSTDISNGASLNGILTTAQYKGAVVYVKGETNVKDGRIVKPEGVSGHPIEVVNATTGEVTVVNSSDLSNVKKENVVEYNVKISAFTTSLYEKQWDAARSQKSAGSKLEEVGGMVGEKIYITTAEGKLADVEILQILPNGDVMIKGKKGDLGGESTNVIPAESFYDMIARDSDGNVLKDQSGQAYERGMDFRDGVHKIVVNGSVVDAEVISQDDAANRIRYEYTDANGNTKAGSSSISEFEAAVKQAEAMAQTAVPVAEQPAAETAVPEQPAAEPAPAEELNEPETAPQLEPESINWDELFERDKDAFFAELQKQYGEKTERFINRFISAAENELAKREKSNPESISDIIENEEKIDSLKERIASLKDMLSRLIAPAEEAAPVVEQTQELPVNAITDVVTINGVKVKAPKKTVVKKPRKAEIMTAAELAARELSLKNGGIKITKDSFFEHTGYGLEEANNLKEIFRLKENGGMSIEEAGERLMEIDREYGLNLLDQNDPMSGVNAILEALGANRTTSDLRSYAARNRQIEMQKEADAIHAYEMELYEALVDEAVRQEVLRNELESGKALTEEEDNELNAKFAEEYYDHEQGTERGEADSLYKTEDIGDLPAAEGGASGGAEGSNHVLQETQPVQTRGEGNTEGSGVGNKVSGENASSPIYNGESRGAEGASSAEVGSALDEDMPDFTQEYERAPVAPNHVADPVAEAKDREEILLDLLERNDVKNEALKRDSAFNAGKEVADFFATYAEFEEYEAEAKDLGKYYEDFARGVKASFANRPSDELHIVEEGLSISSEAQALTFGAVIESLDNNIEVEAVSNKQTQAMLDVKAELSSIEMMTAYHGSPHKFSAFDHSKMGTGEGAQAHGWGTYLAKNRETGVEYAETLRGLKVTIKRNGLDITNHVRLLPSYAKTPLELVSTLIDWHGIDKAKVEVELGLKEAEQKFKNSSPFNYDIREAKLELYKNASVIINSGSWEIEQPQTNLYTVEIPEDDGSNYLNERTLSKGEVERLYEACDKEGIEFTDVIAPETLLDNRGEGKIIYSNLTKIFGSDKAASEFLSRAGFVGIKYTGNIDGDCVVIFNESDAKITGHVEFYQTPNGTVYGWTDGKKIYLTEAGFNPNTPIHEYTHLWARAMMKKNPKGWNSIKNLLKNTPIWDEVVNDPNYSKIKNDEDAVASEAISRLSGSKNAAKLEQMAQQMIDEAKGNMQKVKARGLIQNIKDALNKFWSWVGKHFFEIENFNSIDEITDRVLYDLVNQNDLGELFEGQVETQIKSDNNLVYLPNIDSAIESGEWNDKANVELNNIADDVTKGLAILKRYTPQEHRGLLRGGRLLVEASILSRGNKTDISASKRSFETLKERADKVIPIITTWAKSIGVWREYSNRGLEEITRDYLDSGSEAQVFNLGNGKVEKIIGLDYYIDPQLALDRIAIHNALFPETNLEVVGFGTNKNGEFAIIVHQQTIPALPTEQDKINAYIESLGFKLIDDTNHTFVNQELYLSDLHSDNVLSNDDEKYYIIDGDFRLNTPDAGVGGTRHVDDSIVSNKADKILFRSASNPITPEMDAEYLAAVEAGDIEKAQQMVIEAAKLAMPNTKVVDEKGNPLIVYHGSPYGGITTFNRKEGKSSSGLKEFGHYFSTNENLAKLYKNEKQLSEDLKQEINDEINRLLAIQYNVVNSREYDAIENEIQRLRDILKGKVYRVFLNIENPKTFDAKGKDGWAGWFELKQDVGYDIKKGTDAIEAIAGHNSAAVMPEKYDGIIAKNIADVIVGEEELSEYLGDVFLVFDENPNQIKSAEPVTYDNTGKVIPLSQRFNYDVSDIRYRKADAQNAAVDYLAGDARNEVIENAVNEEAAKLGVNVTFKTREKMEKGHENDKGYYDTRTGEIVICTENNANIADAIQTILHEAVAHKGLRALIGDKFNQFINRVYNSLDAKTKAEVDKLAAEEYDGNTAVAMEEYMAKLAESENFSEQTIWEKIKTIFNNIINSLLGRNDIKIGDSELRYLLGASYNNMVNPNGMQTLEGWAKDLIMRENYGVSEVNTVTPDILSRTGIDPTQISSKTAAQTYNEFVNKVWQEVQRQFQDAYQPVRIAIDAIQQETGNIPIEDYENYLLVQNHASSRSRIEVDTFKRKYYDPLISSVNDIVSHLIRLRGIADSAENRAEVYKEVRQYLIAKHGLERNNYYQRTKEEMRDYSGLTALFGLESSEYEKAEALARKMVDDFETALGRENDENGVMTSQSDIINMLWSRINAATDKTLRHSYECGLISRQQYNDIKSMFSFYVPLRGFDETTAEDVYAYSRFTGNSFSPAVHSAGGRTSVADDPIATIMTMAESEISQGNNNRAKQALYSYLLNRATTDAEGNPKQNSLMQIESVWYILSKDSDGNEIYIIATPRRSEGETLEQFEKRMQKMAEDGQAIKSAKGKVDVGMRFQKKYNENQHYIYLKVNGVEKAIYINGDPKAADAINGRYHKKEGYEKIRKLNRFLSSMFTNYSLEFTVRNLVRDLIYSRINVLMKETDPAYRKKFRANWWRNMFKVLGMLRRYRAGEYDNASLNETERAFVEFMENGGQTGYTLINSVERNKKELERMLENMRAGSKKGIKNTSKAKALFKGIEVLNESSELVTRFSAYQTSRQMGRSIEQSVKDAKEITVNFNTKGAQDGTGILGWFARWFGAVKYFFNASVQGVQNLALMAQKGKGKFGKVVCGLMATGALMPLLQGALASLLGYGDDEDYWNIPEYDRRNNICILIGGGDYITIPLPVGFREMYAIGDMVMASACDRTFDRDIADVAVDMANTIASIVLPVNPFEGSANGLSLIESAAVVALPDAADFAFQWIINKDFKGAPLQKEYGYNANDPKWTKAFSNNPAWLTGLSKWCYELWPEFNWSPEIADNILSNMFGGIYSLTKKTARAIENGINGDFSAGDIPVVGIFFGEGEKNSERFLNSAYWEMNDYYEERIAEVKRVANAFGYTLNDVYKRVPAGKIRAGEHNPEMSKIYNSSYFDYDWMQEWYLGNYGESTVKHGVKAKTPGISQMKNKINELKREIAANKNGKPTGAQANELAKLQKQYDAMYEDFVYDMLELD